ncbi:MAG: hypothetical protein IJQ88_10165, partial [Clostridia bacterium]|nr:hypothetical protein [Clostridia bacterium]
MSSGEQKHREPLQFKNLADLKRHIAVGTELVATFHSKHPDLVGLTRVVTEVLTNGFYSKIKDQPDHRWSTCSYGRGFRTFFEKASAYRFQGPTVQVLDTRANDGSILFEMQVFPREPQMNEQNNMNKEEPDMNEW